MKLHKSAIIIGVIALVVIILFSSWLILKPGPEDNESRKVYFGSGGADEADQEINGVLDETSKDKLEINFINLGTQDSEAILVETRQNIILIDAGNNEAQDELADFLESKNITKIDLFILTNAYVGHVGGADNLVNDFEIGEIWENGISSVLTSYKAYDFLATDKNIDRSVVEVGESKTVDGVKFEVLSPFIGQFTDSGENSLVIRISYGEFSALLMSNCKTECEEDLLTRTDLGSTILKVGDYGSSIATSGDFVELVDPDVAIITGRDPSSKTINTLEELGVTIYEAMDGTIKVVTTGTSYEITQ